jgi:hypothetical protein
LSPVLRKAVQRVIRLQKKWIDADFRRAFSVAVKRTGTRKQFQALYAQYGPLTAGQMLESDGQSWARIRLVSERGAIDMRLILTSPSGKVREIVFTQPRETAFMQ